MTPVPKTRALTLQQLLMWLTAVCASSCTSCFTLDVSGCHTVDISWICSPWRFVWQTDSKPCINSTESTVLPHVSTLIHPEFISAPFRIDLGTSPIHAGAEKMPRSAPSPNKHTRASESYKNALLKRTTMDNSWFSTPSRDHSQCVQRFPISIKKMCSCYLCIIIMIDVFVYAVYYYCDY